VKLSLAIALFKLVVAIVGLLEKQRWYQEGKAAANAEASAEQQRRIEAANAARADADALSADDRVRDPYRRD
jgi:hypothetical protein